MQFWLVVNKLYGAIFGNSTFSYDISYKIEYNNAGDNPPEMQTDGLRKC